MNIEHLNNRNWYLAQYNTAGKNRESLFSWLNEQNVVPWTPLITRKIRRADSRCCYRERIFAIFPGYFFILANFDIQPVSALRRHSAFIDFVKFGGEIKPVNKDIVDGLMKIYPDPVLNPGAREELNAASSIWLTKAQYQYLLRMENTLQPESRIPIQMADQTVYVAQSATTTTTDVGATTTLTPGMITTGFNMTLLPLIQKTGNLQLQMNFNLSDPPTIRSFTSKDGNSYIEMPYTKLRSLSQKVNLKEGQSLVVTGFDQNNTTTSKAGTFTPANPLFGGSQTGKNERSTLVIIITPTFPSGGNNG